MRVLKQFFNGACVAGVFGGILLLSGCASMFGDNTRTVSINSNPEGAAIYVDNVQYGTTPAVVSMPSYIYGGKTITFKKAGYETQSMQVNSTFQLVGLWNILNFPLGTIIDLATGDLVKIDPANLQLNAKLQPGTSDDMNATPASNAKVVASHS